jgi:hypothetical protein
VPAEAWPLAKSLCYSTSRWDRDTSQKDMQHRADPAFAACPWLIICVTVQYWSAMLDACLPEESSCKIDFVWHPCVMAALHEDPGQAPGIGVFDHPCTRASHAYAHRYQETLKMRSRHTIFASKLCGYATLRLLQPSCRNGFPAKYCGRWPIGTPGAFQGGLFPLVFYTIPE